jgi:uncharacterized protein
MPTPHLAQIARELSLAARQVEAAAALLDEGATVPFIARYRKERTGSLDEVAIAAIRDRVAELAELDRRRQAILQSLAERELLTPELQASVDAAQDLTALEDLYLPFRPKRRTRAAMARERGLEPLAETLLTRPQLEPAREAAAFVDAEKGVPDVESALAGARDIIAERVSEDARARARLRELFARKAVLKSARARGKDDEQAAKYRDYFTWSEPAASAPSHRILAMFRGENEGFLSLEARPDEAVALAELRRLFVPAAGAARDQVLLAVDDSYDRLLAPSLETELRGTLKKQADVEAIRVFAANLRELLLAAPLGERPVLAVDPGFRTGCKLACLDRQGGLLAHTTIYPHPPQCQTGPAGATVLELVRRHGIEAIAIGNGTAGRESEAFVRSLPLPATVTVVMVNESGASIYSASGVAREEFPDLDLTVRGAVSIGRRLMDPLAELVKLDPGAIGVGQYQHDVNQTDLARSLDDVVASCVNSVGVEVNTASPQLLAYVSGLGRQLAANVVARRQKEGPFRSRKELLKVARLGPRAFEQCAGFLRIRGASNPLDASAVHPESYSIVEAMASDLGATVGQLMADEALRGKIERQRYVSGEVGLPTLTDICAELARPGRDPRQRFEPFRFADGVNAIEDLQPGMRLPGIVTNVTAFGAFVDVGVHQDGLVHISQLANRFVKDPAEVVRVQQRVNVTVLEVDLKRKRIALSMKR